MVFPIVMYRFESWIIKKAECQKINAFEFLYWIRLLRVPWMARISNQSILKEINPEYIGRTDAKAETPILWPPDTKNWLIGKDWCWERLRVGGEGDDRGWDGWMASPTQWTWVWTNSRSWWLMGKPGVLQCMGPQIDTTELLNWTETNWVIICQGYLCFSHPPSPAGSTCLFPRSVSLHCPANGFISTIFLDPY